MQQRTALLPIAALSFLLFGCQSNKEADQHETTKPAAEQAESPITFDEDELSFFEPLPAFSLEGKSKTERAKIDLGRALYYEERLSKSQHISCNSCHRLDGYGVDNEPTSPGHKGQRGGRNSPTVYNASQYIAQFWDGRAADLTAQAKGPILNPVEMAMKSEAATVAVLKSIPGYKAMFKAAFPKAKNPITYDNMADAIGTFEAGLFSRDRFDRFLEGDKDALTQKEKQGLKHFIGLGCTSCHNGPAIGGSSYQKLGLVNAYEDEDLGRFEVTQQEADKQKFKVPSLRNIAKTGPYFHRGQNKTLEETVTLMAWHQLGIKIDDQKRDAIIAFLNALTGELPTEYIAKPELPPSGPKTPKPDPS